MNAGHCLDLAALIRTEVDAQATYEDRRSPSGPELVLSPRAAEVLTPAVHDLATDALNTARSPTQPAASGLPGA